VGSTNTAIADLKAALRVADTVRVRIAPSPTGMFHVGNARTALWNWLFARHHGGVFVLRIEDTDVARNRPEWIEGIESALRWLELDWDEGPLLSSDNAAAHARAAERLLATGRAYYCDCTPEARQARAEVRGQAPGRPQGYDGFCRDRGLGPGPGRALRFRVPDGKTVVEDVVRGRVEFDNAAIEDFVIVKSDGGPLFYLANTVDDLSQGITHVMRGEEHLPNTPKNQLLWTALADPPPAPPLPPPVWAHLPLLVNERRQKLSSRRDQTALESYRAQGYLMEAVRNYLCLLGWAPGDGREMLTLAEMVAEFRPEDVNPSPAYFDVNKLTAFNERYLKAMTPAAFAAAAAPFLDPSWDASRGGVIERLAPALQTRVRTLAEVGPMVDFLFLPEPRMDAGAWRKVMAQPGAAEILASAIDAYGSCAWERDVLHDELAAIGARLGLALAKAQAPVRVAVTGRTVGPPLFESLVELGREETVRRLTVAADLLRRDTPAQA